MSAETLRRAAALMRERAEGARSFYADHHPRAGQEVPWFGEVDLYDFDDGDGPHIIGMSPAVALAVADWLEDAAGPLWCDGCGSSDDECRTSPDRGFIKCCPDCGHGRKALAVARAYLGTPA